MILMDLGEVGLLLVTRGEEEARRAVENFVRASDDATRSLEANAQKMVRAEEARERAIQKQIKTQMELVNQAGSLRRSYEDLSASFDRMEKATLDYYRTEEMLQKGMAAGVVSGTEYARVMGLVEQRLIEVAGAIRVEDMEARIALQERETAEIAKASAAYDSVIAGLDETYAANIRYSESLRKINDAHELGIINEKERLNAIKLVNDEFNSQLESPRVKQMERERDESNKLKQEHAQLASEYARLTASVNPAVRAQQIYDTAIKTLDRSLSKGIITQDMYNATLADVRVQMERAGHTVNQFGQVMSTSERGFAKFARGGMQQLGYQVGDFAVQVQGGTSMLVAFGQQGAQLAGIFGATGAVIGAGIAIVTSLAHAYLQARGEGKNLKETTSDMNESFQTLNSTLDDLNSDEFKTKFGSMSEEMKSMTEAALNLDNAMALKNLSSTLDKLKETYIEPGFFQDLAAYSMATGGAYGGVQGGVRGGTAGADMAARVQEGFRQENFAKLGFDMGYDTFKGYQKAIDEAAKSGGMDEITRLLTEMYVDAAPDIESAQKIIASGGYEMLDAYRKLAVATAEANARLKEHREGKPIETEMVIAKERGHMEAIASATDSATKASYRRFQQESKVKDVLDDIGIYMADQRGHQEAINSAQDRSNRGAYARYVLESQNLQRLKDEALADKLMEAYRVGKDITTLNLALGIDGAAIVASRLASQLGISLDIARQIVGLGKGDPIVYDPRDPAYDPIKAARGRAAAIKAGAPVYEPPKPDKDRGGGGAKSDPMQELRAQLKLENEMLVLTKEQQRVYQALGEDRTKYSKVEIDSLSAEIKSIEDKKKAIEDMQSISDTIQSSMSDAFMSMVDGTATVQDAFKNMARAIIAQLYEVMVVQRIVGQFDVASNTGTGLVGGLMKLMGGVTAQANGGAWMYGNQVTPYANGGVVMTPTMFGMSGNRRGVMGEAGPEAILPLSRNSKGKLGVAVAGGGSNTITEPTNIHNNFNISGSDAETVRREIEKALPRISEVTKAAVLDSRRRGGKMMATF
jgi:hypothetical protein